MGNCCASSGGSKAKKNKKPNPFAGNYTVNHRSDTTTKLHVLKDPTGRDIDALYELGRELGRGEFGITYMATDLETGDKFACKSISKKKMRTAVDIEDVRREVEIMKHLPKHANIVTLRDTFEDDSAVHIVMELCEGGELFDRIVARGHYTERAAAAVVKTIVDVVQKRCFLYPLGLLNLLYIRQMCHRHGVRPSAARPASDSGELHTPARQLLRRGMTRRDLRRTNPRRATTREGIYKCLNWGRWGTPCGVPPLLLLDEEEVLHMRHNGRHVAINLWEFIVR